MSTATVSIITMIMSIPMSIATSITMIAAPAAAVTPCRKPWH